MIAQKKASELDGCVFKPDIVIKLNITYKHRIISIYQLYSLLFNLLQKLKYDYKKKLFSEENKPKPVPHKYNLILGYKNVYASHKKLNKDNNYNDNDNGKSTITSDKLRGRKSSIKKEKGYSISVWLLINAL